METVRYAERLPKNTITNCSFNVITKCIIIIDVNIILTIIVVMLLMMMIVILIVAAATVVIIVIVITVIIIKGGGDQDVNHSRDGREVKVPLICSVVASTTKH